MAFPQIHWDDDLRLMLTAPATSGYATAPDLGGRNWTRHEIIRIASLREFRISEHSYRGLPRTPAFLPTYRAGTRLGDGAGHQVYLTGLTRRTTWLALVILELGPGTDLRSVRAPPRDSSARTDALAAAKHLPDSAELLRDRLQRRRFDTAGQTGFIIQAATATAAGFN